jgi:aspartyl protease family protein
VLTEADAALAGIRPAPGDYSGSARTAAGAVPVAPVLIERLSVGGIEQRNVAAVVVRGGALPQSLLGQSFLSGVGEVRISGDRMDLN